MIGLGTVFAVAKMVKPFAGGIKKVVKVATQKDSRDEFAELYASFKSKSDTDKDGKSDWTKQEMVEFLAEVALVIAKRL